MKNRNKKKDKIAIKVNNLSKQFRIPHEKIDTVKGAFVSVLKSRSYEEFHALKDVSFEVKKGEFFGIIGRNGSGKSTLLKILAGIYEADSGKVQIEGMVSPFLELGIGFNPELSGRDNIYLNATVLGMTKKQIDEKFDSIVKFSELERFIDQKLKNYSSGMQVRLAFSVSIHANRDILLMDEVLAVGDSNFQSKCLEEFNRYRDLGKTVVLVSHDIATIKMYCDKAILLEKGVLKIFDKADVVCNEYIKRNIVEEEYRMGRDSSKKQDKLEKDEKEKKKGRDGKSKIEKVVEIAKVDFMDEEGAKRKVFGEGESVTVRVSYKNRKKIERAVFGLEIYSETGYRLYGTHSDLQNKVVRLDQKKGFVDFCFEANVFLSGVFYISPAIASTACASMYDYIDKEHSFKIKSVSLDQGCININAKLK